MSSVRLRSHPISRLLSPVFAFTFSTHKIAIDWLLCRYLLLAHHYGRSDCQVIFPAAPSRGVFLSCDPRPDLPILHINSTSRLLEQGILAHKSQKESYSIDAFLETAET